MTAGNLVSRVSRAFRRAVQQDIQLSKECFFLSGNVVCPVTGAPLTKLNSQVDHVAPMTFQVIVMTYLAARDLHHADIRLEPINGMAAEYVLASAGIAEDFRQYHARVACLDVLSIQAHNNIGNKHNIRPGRLRVVLAP